MAKETKTTDRIVTTVQETESDPDFKLNKAEALLAAEYLHSFGYLKDWRRDEDTLVERIKQAQRILEVPVDGSVGKVTLKAMLSVPRCGLPDYQAATGQLNQWLRDKARTGLTYGVVRYVTGLSEETQTQILEQAWADWMRVCGLRIRRITSGNPDILIDASAKKSEQFGTPYNVLAWAYLPNGSRHTSQLIMKFDLAETWVDDPARRGILLRNVACHEFGHLLGLDHTQIRGELLYPTYAAEIVSPQRQYDIPQVVDRYGQPESVPPPVDPPPVDPSVPRVSGQIDINGYKYELRRVG